MGNKFSDTCIFLTSYGFFDFRFGSCTRSDTFEGRGLVEAEVSLSKGQSSKRKQNGVKWGNFMRTISMSVINTQILKSSLNQCYYIFQVINRSLENINNGSQQSRYDTQSIKQNDSRSKSYRNDLNGHSNRDEGFSIKGKKTR